MRAFIAFTILLTIFFWGCGYKPTSLFANKILGDSIYAEVEISIKDPQNSILIKDAINEAILNKFKGRISSKEDATSKLYVKLNSISFVPIQYDKNGYVLSYKTYVSIKTTYYNRGGRRDTITTRGDYDFPIKSNSVISDTKRFEAIKFASLKAIDEFISKVSTKGIINDYK